jgi:hypothetical protein
MALFRVPDFWLNMPIRALELIKQFTRRVVICTHRGNDVLIVDMYDASRSVIIPAWTLPTISPPCGAFHLREDIYVIKCFGSDIQPTNWLLLYRLSDGSIIRTIRIHSGRVVHTSKLDDETIVTVSHEGIHFHRCPDSLPRDEPTLTKTVNLQHICQFWVVDRDTALVVCRKTRFTYEVGLVNGSTVKFFATSSNDSRHCRIGKSMILVGHDTSFDVFDFSQNPPRKVHTETHNNRSVEAVVSVYGDRTGRDCFSNGGIFARLLLPSIPGFSEITACPGDTGEKLSIEHMKDLPELTPTRDLIFLGPNVLVIGKRGHREGMYRYDKMADGTWKEPVEIAARGRNPWIYYEFHTCKVENVPDAAFEAFVSEVHAAKEWKFGCFRGHAM